MQPINILDWAIIAVSLFNTIILLWLGLTVLLNADRRRWDTWAAGGGFLLGGLFFVGHSAVVGRVIGTFSAEMEFWWRISWVLIAGAPYMWYLVMLAYTGVLDAGRHRAWLLITTLPGGGLLHYWRRSLMLAAGYGALVGASLSIPPLTEVDSIYRLLLATVLMTLFFALLTWRSYVDRERGMDRLRPFVAPGLTYSDKGRMTEERRAGIDDGRSADRDTRSSDSSSSFALPALAGLAALFGSPQTMCVPLDPQHYGGAVWAVPLWSERGLIGVLLLGDKRGVGVYTQEEIERSE